MITMKILVLGAGMVAHYLRQFQGHSKKRDDNPTLHEIHFASRTGKEWDNFYMADIRDPQSLERVADMIRPDVIVNLPAASSGASKLQ